MENRTMAAYSFEKIKSLGCGTFGRVHLVRQVGGSDAGKLFAQKETDKIALVANALARETIMKERLALERVRGLPFISTLHYAFETESALNLVLEYASGGDFYSIWMDYESLPEPRVQFYMAELVLALEQLHTRDVIHGDIKLENLLMDSAGHILLTDFGYSKIVLKDQPMKLGGTCEYMAPEVVKNTPGQGFASDWWSVGVVAYELLVGTSPFRPEDGSDRCPQKIYKNIVTKEPDFPWTLSARAKAFIKALLVKDPGMRLGARGTDDIKAHPFFEGVVWDHVMRKACLVPIVPTIRHELDVSNFDEEVTSMAVTEPLLVQSGWKGIRMFPRYTYPSATVTTPEPTSPSRPAEMIRHMTSSTKRALAARVVERAKRLKLNAIRYPCSSVTERVISSPVHDDVVVMENVVDVTAPLETRFSPLGEKEVIDAVLVEGAWV